MTRLPQTLERFENPRLSNLTLKIMAVNAVTLLILLIGVMYLGQYRTKLVEAKLQTFASEVELIAMGLSLSDPAMLPNTIEAFATETRHVIAYYNADGSQIIHSKLLQPAPRKRILHSVEILKRIIRFMPRFASDSPLQPFPKNTYPGLENALQGKGVFSAWQGEHDHFVLSAAAPVKMLNNENGAIFVTRDAYDIEDELHQIWLNFIVIFLGAFLLTLLLSIYFASTIARPLKRLSRAAMRVAAGKPYSITIPDLTHRYDEIGDLSQSLRTMTDTLWSRMNAIDSFAADVSHELKNPLTSLKSAVETLPKVTKAKDRTALLAIIVQDIDRIDRLITDIAKSSRLDAELGRDILVRVNLKACLQNVINRYRDQTYASHLAVAETIAINFKNESSEPVHVKAIPEKLEQVLHNIIDNALSFAPDSAVLITLKTKHTIARITISDSGPGIPHEKLDTIFERFYTDRKKTIHTANHSGLGLSICRQIINAMSGRIYAENKSNDTGARFVIELPLL